MSVRGAAMTSSRGLEPLRENRTIVAHDPCGPASRDPAIDHQIVTVHEAGGITGEKQRHLRDVVCRRHPGQRLPGRQNFGKTAPHYIGRLVGLVAVESGAFSKDSSEDGAWR